MPKGYIINLVVVVVVVVLVVPVLNQFQTTAAKAASSRQMARPSFALLLRLVFPSCHTFLVYGSVQNMHGKLAFAAPIPSRINPTNRVSPHHYHQLDNHTRAHAHTHTRPSPRLQCLGLPPLSPPLLSQVYSRFHQPRLSTSSQYETIFGP